MSGFKKQFDKILGIRVLFLVISDILIINGAALGGLLTRFEFSIQSLEESGFL